MCHVVFYVPLYTEYVPHEMHFSLTMEKPAYCMKNTELMKCKAESEKLFASWFFSLHLDLNFQQNIPNLVPIFKDNHFTYDYASLHPQVH